MIKEKPILFSGSMVRALIASRKSQTRRALKPQPIRVHNFHSPRRQKKGDVFIGPDMLPTETQCRLVFGVALSAGSIRCLGSANFCAEYCPYGAPGGHLWVKENYYQRGHWEKVTGIKQRTRTGRQRWAFIPESADIRFDPPPYFRKGRNSDSPETVQWHKRLARFMPKIYNRITLEIVSIGVERVQDITEVDALAEGVTWPENLQPPIDTTGMSNLRLAAKQYGELWDSINGPGSWAANPWVWKITFKVL